MNDNMLTLLSGQLLDEELELTLTELCRACRLPTDQLIELVEEGIIEPRGRGTAHWRFQGTSVRRVRCAIQLRRDLGVNWPGAALALELLDEIDALRARLERFDS